ncbi:heme exporter protein CcmD [Paracoccus caeni]|uniref:Heme exporter protein D n=1 Tax=Paracoccus caeni TaxID=657651 RepID=A0A934SIR2_9RHOB|nr:heme exporter protein CcmD [Paracoccus caeni]MBK4215188.1 heme exporter protein CcmD [Paracoccus caeni]
MIDLGKYAGTVLAAYGISVLLLVGLVWHSIAANTRARRALEKQEGRKDA